MAMKTWMIALRRRWRSLLTVLTSAIFLGPLGCLIPPKAEAPIANRWLPHPDGQGEDLIIFLPGRWDSPDNYERYRFLETAWEEGWKVDGLLVDAHLGYYYTRTLAQRFAEDIWPQVDARGYRQVWISGISLGGLGSIFTSIDTPDRIDGIIVLSPFLGDEADVLDRLDQYGAANFRPEEPIALDDFNQILWAHLRGYADPNERRPELWLAYGAEDDYTDWQKHLASMLPDNQVIVLPGDHSWDTWQTLWPAVIQRRPWEEN